MYHFIRLLLLWRRSCLQKKVSSAFPLKKRQQGKDFETTSFMEGPYVYRTIYIQKKGILTSNANREKKLEKFRWLLFNYTMNTKLAEFARPDHEPKTSSSWKQISTLLFHNLLFEVSYEFLQQKNLCKPNNTLQCFLIFSGSLTCSNWNLDRTFDSRPVKIQQKKCMCRLFSTFLLSWTIWFPEIHETWQLRNIFDIAAAY